GVRSVLSKERRERRRDRRFVVDDQDARHRSLESTVASWNEQRRSHWAYGCDDGGRTDQFAVRLALARRERLQCNAAASGKHHVPVITEVLEHHFAADEGGLGEIRR